MTDELKSPPKNGRIDKYSKEFLELFEKLKNSPNSLEQTRFEAFMTKFFFDCQIYLKKELGVSFPNITLTFVYDEDEFAELSQKLDLYFGPKPYRKAIVVGSSREAHIYVNVQDHLIGKTIDFIANLCASFIEELVHMINPRKSETQIHDLVCSMLEGFLEMRLPEHVKRERLRLAKEYDNTVKISRK